MTARVDILDQRDSLKKPLAGSVALHVAVFGTVIAIPMIQGLRKHEPWGDINSGGPGSVAVTAVARIPLPARAGQVNPLANDTQAVVPAAPPKPKPQERVREPEPDAIPLRSKNAKSRPARESASNNKFRAQQRDLPNQMYSQTGPALVSPLIGQVGSGGVGIGTGSPLGRRFGTYAMILRDQVARNWNTSQVDPRYHTAPVVIVTFTLMRNGQVKNVRLAQGSGIPLLDASAQRAI
jgi:protein TonB